MYLKKFLNQPNGVGTLLIVLLFGAGVIFTFGFNGFNIGTIADGNAEALLHLSMSGNCGDDDDDDGDDEDEFDCKCITDSNGNKVSCNACEEDNKCSGSKTPSSCIGSCAGDFCSHKDNAGYCGGDNAVHDEYCPKDPDANKYYCEEDTSGCSEEDN